MLTAYLNRLRVFLNRVLRKIFDLGGTRKQESGEEALCFVLLTKNYLGDQKSRKILMDGAFGTCAGQEMCTQGFGLETVVKETTWKMWCRWEYNMKMNI
jgi:hypothetical protein